MTARDRIAEPWGARTKTGRAPQLQAAAPQVWVEISVKDAADLGIDEDNVVEVSSPRGTIRAPARISGIRDGVVFVPFHYGYWDISDPDDHHRAANELTIIDWDPVSETTDLQDGQRAGQPGRRRRRKRSTGPDEHRITARQRRCPGHPRRSCRPRGSPAGRRSTCMSSPRSASVMA